VPFELAQLMHGNAVFKHPEYEGDIPPTAADVDLRRPQRHVYSRYTQPVATRVEAVLSQVTVCLPFRFDTRRQLQQANLRSPVIEWPRAYLPIRLVGSICRYHSLPA
jgi:hypothetical protein